MASTASGWQYAVPNDTLVAWPAVSQAVADKLQTDLPKPAGMVHLATVTLTNASLITFNNVFTSAYDNYFVDIAITSGASATDMNINLKSGATVINGANYNYLRQFFGLSLSTMNNQTSFPIARMEAPGNSTQICINNPFLAQKTFFTSTSYDTAYLAVAACNHTLSTSYDGFQIGVASNTNGVVRLYGKRNS